VFLGAVPVGQRLWIRALDGGSVEASLEGRDVTDRLRTIPVLSPGTPWDEPVDGNWPPAKALRLVRGENDLWFLPVAHFDELGLDRFLLALPDLLLQQGRFDETSFDRSLFYQDPALVLRVSWIETEPASFEIHLPAGGLLGRVHEGETTELARARAQADRDHLALSLGDGAQKLKAAGVRASVELDSFSETQRQLDVLRAVMPIVQREVGPSGADRIREAGGVFEVTAFDDSIFR
jgi:hypothetical protein